MQRDINNPLFLLHSEFVNVNIVTVAMQTQRALVRVKSHKIAFKMSENCRGSDPAGRAYDAPPDHGWEKPFL